MQFVMLALRTDKQPLLVVRARRCKMVATPPRLTLRRTQIPDAGPDDRSVILDGKEIIGRIYRAPNRQGDPWFWGLTMFPSSSANSGYASHLDEAKARLKARWRALGGG